FFCLRMCPRHGTMPPHSPTHQKKFRLRIFFCFTGTKVDELVLLLCHMLKCKLCCSVHFFVVGLEMLSVSCDGRTLRRMDGKTVPNAIRTIVNNILTSPNKSYPSPNKSYPNPNKSEQVLTYIRTLITMRGKRANQV